MYSVRGCDRSLTMVPAFIPAFLIFAFLAPISNGADVPCPFYADKCKCTQDDSSSDSQTFATVLCESVVLAETIFSSPLRTYRVTGWMKITGDVSTAVPDHFGAFQSIYELNLEQTFGDLPTDQRWQAHTFSVVRITSLNIQGLGNLLPDPDLSSLQRLSITRSSAMRITGAMGKNFAALTSLSIDRTPVSIDDNAFDSLTDQFVSLSLTDASLTEFPVKAISSLKNLRTMRLERNKIATIPADAFSKLANLERVYLKDNPITSIDKTAFTSLVALVHLDLSGTAMTTLDLSMFAVDRKSPEVLKLRFDSSKAMKSVTVSGDPREFPEAVMITIKDSALETIDPKVGDILQQKTAVLMDIENNQNLRCDEQLKWVAPLVHCTLKLMTDNAKCASPDKYKGKPLGEYIADIEPNPECTTGTPPKTTPTAAPPVTKKASGPLTASGWSVAMVLTAVAFTGIGLIQERT